MLQSLSSRYFIFVMIENCSSQNTLSVEHRSAFETNQYSYTCIGTYLTILAIDVTHYCHHLLDIVPFYLQRN